MKQTLLIVSLFVTTLFFGQTREEYKEFISTEYKVDELVTLIDRMYVEEVDKEKLYLDFIKGMHNRLSPFKAYQEESIFNKVEGYTPQSSIQGIGISFKFKGDTLLVKEVIPNSGADKAGIKEGDKIVGIDGDNLDDIMYYIDVARKFEGRKNSAIKLKISDGKEEKEVEVKRTEVPGYKFTVLGEKGNDHAINDFKVALSYFDAVYPDSIKKFEIVEYGLQYMLEQLDPHSAYISLKELHDMNAPLKGSFSGVGVRFQIIKDTIMVVQTIPGGPSEKVGIQAGDQFIFIDEEMVAGIGMTNTGVRDRLLGDKGTKVKVKMRRKGAPEPIEFTIERDKIPIYSLDAAYMAAPGIGYVKLNNFSATTIDELKVAIPKLKEQGMKDIVIDLQSNGGGYLMTAVKLADMMLSGDKLVVYTEGRKYPKYDYDASKPGILEEGRVIVLVNESSASASEIVSGAIQDWDRGLIVGRRTFGKGLVQKPIYLTDGTQVRITTQRYYTPAGRCIQKSYEGGSYEYRKEKYERYNSGESFHKDSIHVVDSLKYETKVKHRTVYGGGGIVPDVFVPLDTNSTSKYYSQLIRKGILNQFTLKYVNDNREKLQSKYITFEQFKKGFDPKKVVKDLFEYAEKEGLEYDDEGYKKAEKVILTRLKANVAQNLYDYHKFYEIINDLNDELQEAIRILQSGKEFKVIE